MHRTLILALAPALALAQPAKLSLKQAVEIALAPDGNTRVQLAGELVRQSHARSAEARSALLPNLDGQFAYQSQLHDDRALRFLVIHESGLIHAAHKHPDFSRRIQDLFEINPITLLAFHRWFSDRAIHTDARAHSNSARSPRQPSFEGSLPGFG